VIPADLRESRRRAIAGGARSLAAGNPRCSPAAAAVRSRRLATLTGPQVHPHQTARNEQRKIRLSDKQCWCYPNSRTQQGSRRQRARQREKCMTAIGTWLYFPSRAASVPPIFVGAQSGGGGTIGESGVILAFPHSPSVRAIDCRLAPLRNASRPYCALGDRMPSGPAFGVETARVHRWKASRQIVEELSGPVCADCLTFSQVIGRFRQ